MLGFLISDKVLFLLIAVAAFMAIKYFISLDLEADYYDQHAGQKGEAHGHRSTKKSHQ